MGYVLRGIIESLFVSIEKIFQSNRNLLSITINSYSDLIFGTADIRHTIFTLYTLFTLCTRYTIFTPHTRGTTYILSLIMKNMSSKMALLFFKVFSFVIYTLLHTFEHFLSIGLHQSTLASF